MMRRLITTSIARSLLRRGVSSGSSSTGGVVVPSSTPAGAVPTFPPNGVLLVPPPVLQERILSNKTKEKQQQQQQQQQDDIKRVSLSEGDNYLTLLERDVWGVALGLDGEGELGLRRVFSGDGGDGSDKAMMRGVAVKIAQSINDSRNSCEMQRRQPHPFMATAGGLFFGSDLDVVTPGALVLLFERALLLKKGISSHHHHHHNYSSSPSCVSVARAVVKTCGGYEIHRTVGEEDASSSNNNVNYQHQGNKLATLTGDLLVISLIKDVVAGTRSNKVLELTMESLSEFSVGEVAGRRVFSPTNTDTDTDNANNNARVRFIADADLLAESWVVARGLESVGVLVGCNATVLHWLREVGLGLGTLWKVHYDLSQFLGGGDNSNSNPNNKFIENKEEMVEYVLRVGGEVRRALSRGGEGHYPFIKEDPAISAVHALIDHWEMDVISCSNTKAGNASSSLSS